LTNIRKTRNPIRLKGIEGQTINITEMGDLLGYGSVYYNPQVMANVLSFHNMIKRFKSVVYDNQNTDARDVDTIMEFRPSPEGLYYYDFNTSINRQQRGEQTMVVESVEKLLRNYTEKEIKRAEAARRLYVMMGRPSKADFQKMLQKGKI